MTRDSDARQTTVPGLGAHRAASALAIAMAAALIAGCDTDIGDQSCTEDSKLESDRDDQCPFGAPGGPNVSIDNDLSFCPDPPEIDEAGTGCGTTYTWEGVFQIFNTPNLKAGGGNCMASSCHGAVVGGPPPQDEPPMYAAGSRETYDSLMNYGVSKHGRPYIRGVDEQAAGTPKQAWIMCNLTSLTGIIMPRFAGFQAQAEGTHEELPIVDADVGSIEYIRRWVNCGMRFDGGGVVGGAGGGGGAGGEAIGGAGGAGGVGGI